MRRIPVLVVLDLKIDTVSSMHNVEKQYLFECSEILLVFPPVLVFYRAEECFICSGRDLMVSPPCICSLNSISF